jgi:hypothetical protein
MESIAEQSQNNTIAEYISHYKGPSRYTRLLKLAEADNEG